MLREKKILREFIPAVHPNIPAVQKLREKFLQAESKKVKNKK